MVDDTSHEETPRSILGANLRAARKAKGWNLSKLAAEAGLDGQTIYWIERGRRGPRLVTLEKIAAALGVSVISLLGGDDGQS